MELAKHDLSISAENILHNWLFVIEAENMIKGFFELRGNTKDEAELFWLFVDPISIGQGYGKTLGAT